MTEQNQLRSSETEQMGAVNLEARVCLPARVADDLTSNAHEGERGSRTTKRVDNGDERGTVDGDGDGGRTVQGKIVV